MLSPISLKGNAATLLIRRANDGGGNSFGEIRQTFPYPRRRAYSIRHFHAPSVRPNQKRILLLSTRRRRYWLCDFRLIEINLNH